VNQDLRRGFYLRERGCFPVVIIFNASQFAGDCKPAVVLGLGLRPLFDSRVASGVESYYGRIRPGRGRYELGIAAEKSEAVREVFQQAAAEMYLWFNGGFQYNHGGVI
jgi:hypothetical protein